MLRLSPPQEPQNRKTPLRESPSTRAPSAGLTGSVCKEQGRIHRAIVTRDYWGFHVHAGEFQPAIPTGTGFRGLATPFGVASHCPGHCRARVARGIRGMSPTVARSFLRLTPAVPSECPRGLPRDGNRGHGFRSLPDLTGPLTARADDGHAPPLSSSGRVFSPTFILLSTPVRCLALTPIKPHPPPLVVLPRQFL